MRSSLGRWSRRTMLGCGTFIAVSGLWASSASAQFYHDASDKAEGRYTGRSEAAGGSENTYEAPDDSYNNANSNRAANASDNDQDRATRRRSNDRDRDRSNAMDDENDRGRRSDRDRNRQTSDRSNNDNRRSYSRDQTRNDNERDRNADRDRHATGRDQNTGVTWSNQDDRLTAERVDRNGDLARAGLEKGDQLMSVNGQRVRTQAELNRALASAQPGRQAALGIRRDGERETIYYVPNARQFSNNSGRNSAGSHNDSHANNHSGESSHNAFLGVQLDERYPRQAVVRQVYHNSPAEKSGLRPGDVILAVNGQQITSAQQLSHEVAEMEPGKSANIHISRPQTRDIEVHLGTRNAQASYHEDDRDRSQRSDRSQSSDRTPSGETESERDQQYDIDHVGTSQD